MDQGSPTKSENFQNSIACFGKTTENRKLTLEKILKFYERKFGFYAKGINRIGVLLAGESAFQEESLLECYGRLTCLRYINHCMN